jgi:hypothetical protein
VAINLEFDNYEEVISFIQREKDLLFTETLTEIKESIKNNKKIANVANLMVNDSVISINVEKSDWALHLNVSIGYFQRIEDYETCVEIRDILKSL